MQFLTFSNNEINQLTKYKGSDKMHSEAQKNASELFYVK